MAVIKTEYDDEEYEDKTEISFEEREKQGYWIGALTAIGIVVILLGLMGL
jgi:hypothetical protein